MTTIVKGRWYPDMPPALDGEDDDRYTNRLVGVYGPDRVPYDHPRNRQCSIGYHTECSDPCGGECECPCHAARHALQRAGFAAPLPMPGSVWEKPCEPEGHVLRSWIESVGPTMSGWQATVRTWEIDNAENLVDPDNEDGTKGILYVSRLLAEFQCVREAR
jgi:hypothetical protein